MADLISRYVRFTFDEYAKDPYGWITKNPPSVAEFERLYDRRTVNCPYCSKTEDPYLLDRADCPTCGGTGLFIVSNRRLIGRS